LEDRESPASENRSGRGKRRPPRRSIRDGQKAPASEGGRYKGQGKKRIRFWFEERTASEGVPYPGSFKRACKNLRTVTRDFP